MTKNSNLYFLWCVPRSRSTAFEKMMAGTEQFKVIGEPFIDIYKQGIKSQQDFTIAKQSFDKKFAVLLSNSIHQPLFVKDMGYHAIPFISDEQIKAARHAFLIRDPGLSIPSLYKMRQDFHENEAGFDGQVALYKKIYKLSSNSPHVFDAEILAASPHKTVSDYFQSINAPMPKSVLNWQAGSRSDWQGRESWHVDAINSNTFFHSQKNIDESLMPIRVKEIIKQNLPHYHFLRDQMT
jgi:hypothetical protein